MVVDVSHTLAGFAVFAADTAGVCHVVTLIVIFYITNIRREELCTSFFAVLPNLLNLHFFRIDSIADAVGEIVGV